MKQVLATLFFVTTMIFSASGQTATATPVEEAATATPALEATMSHAQPAASLAQMVRDSTSDFQDLRAAQDAGYALLHGCVSGPQGGAMGVHFANGDLVGDGELDVQHPEALIYEASYGQLRLVAVEYVVLAENWDANNQAPPVLMGQLFNYNSTPNRYGLPAFYELHVWAWKHNPDGTFADWNPLVSCEEYTGDAMMHEAGQ